MAKTKNDKQLEKIRETISDVSAFAIDRPDGQYTIGEKLIAIDFLNASQRQIDDKMIPKFSEIGKMLGINESVMRSWWDKREELQKLGSTVVASLPLAVSTMLAHELLRMTKALGSFRYEDMTPKEFGYLFSQVASKMRLFSGASTENIAVSHQIVNPYIPANK